MIEGVDRRHLLIAGFSSARIKDPKAVLGILRESFPRVEVQLMRADRIAGTEHLSFATLNAVRAFGRKYKRSRSLAMEILLYASCQRQISKAIELLGVTAATRQVGVAALSTRIAVLEDLQEALRKLLGGKVDDGVLEIRTNRKLSELRRVFGILDRELEASRQGGEGDAEVVKRLVIERSALLALEG